MSLMAKLQKLHHFIDASNSREIDSPLSFIEKAMVPEVPYNKWDDAEFVAEMNCRVIALEDDTDKGSTWEEVNERAKIAVRPKINS